MIVCQAEEGSKQSTTALQAVQQEADKQKQAVATAQAMCKKVRLSSPQASQHLNPCSFTCGFSRLLGSCCLLTVHYEAQHYNASDLMKSAKRLKTLTPIAYQSTLTTTNIQKFRGVETLTS